MLETYPEAKKNLFLKRLKTMAANSDPRIGRLVKTKTKYTFEPSAI